MGRAVEPAAEFRRAEDGREGRGAARLNVRGAAAYGKVQGGGSAVQLCEKKKREGEGRARPASSGKAQQASRVAPYPAWGGEAEKETTQRHLEMFLQMNA